MMMDTISYIGFAFNVCRIRHACFDAIITCQCMWSRSLQWETRLKLAVATMPIAHLTHVVLRHKYVPCS